MEMTRYSLETLARDTGVTAVDVQNRMTDFGIDAFWLSHEPWLVAEPFTPEAGETWSLEDIDEWIGVLEHVCREAYEQPEVVRSAPHHQVTSRIDGLHLDDPAYWATTWRAYQRKHGPGRFGPLTGEAARDQDVPFLETPGSAAERISCSMSAAVCRSTGR